ncbi:glycosyltransferase [Paeniglutamicibacter sp. NPDC012692]|uniref:glycosyltransferase n=1 Tax=Paeniglutamicibacter sp. NPDC012692 TaxID=3364388 RepID=UPI0036D18F6A
MNSNEISRENLLSELEASERNSVLRMEIGRIKDQLNRTQAEQEKVESRLVSEIELLTKQNQDLSIDLEALGLVIKSSKKRLTENTEYIDGTSLDLGSRQVQANDISELRIAGIMDEFTGSAFASACILNLPKLETWQSEFIEFQPNLIIVESAWQGNGGSWAGKIHRISPELQELLRWSKKNNVPTVFWNKEDPVHYNSFLSTATLFDYVFTTDIGSIERYKMSLGHNNVYLMPFFCQPGLHSPVNSIDRKSGASFAGAYYNRYPERSRDFDSITNALDGLMDTTIYDRNFGENKPEFTFPERYKKYIKGKLPYSEIDKSYKGYDFGINMNSVKQSQSMFARRIFDLILSNTHVISNYSRGLRLMFGDLVTSSDYEPDIRSSVKALIDESGSTAMNAYSAFVRYVALQKALHEHTTADRLEYMASKIWVTPPVKRIPTITVIGHASSKLEAERLQSMFESQKWVNKKLVIVASGLTRHDTVKIDTSTRIIFEQSGQTIDQLVDSEFVTIFDPSARYDTEFLSNSIYMFSFGEHEAVVRCPNPDDKYGLRSAFSSISSAVVSRAVCRTDALAGHRVWRCEDRQDRIAGGEYLVIPSFDYSEINEDFKEVDDWGQSLNTGISMSRLLTAAEQIPQVEPITSFSRGLNSRQIQEMFSRREVNTNLSTASIDSGARLTSMLDTESHMYVYADSMLTVESFLAHGNNDGAIHAVMTLGLMSSLVVLYFDESRNRIGNEILSVNQNHKLIIPDDSTHIHLGIRVQGSGTADILGIAFEEIHSRETTTPELSVSRHLVLTNVYPSPSALYRNGFVHSRVRRYQASGVDASVFAFNPRAKAESYTFDNVDVQIGGSAELRRLIESNNFDSILVHFLDTAMWAVLNDYISLTKIIVWVHGAEIQPWYRREFNYANENERDKAKFISDMRIDFWRSVFPYKHPNLHYVFVSKYFFEEVSEDIGIRLDEWQYSIIHNFIDTEIFKYETKPADQRFRILSIRPFASRKYANDLSVETVLLLKEHPMFNSSVFHFLGDGALFDEVLAPLQGLENVKVERKFLSQPEIAGHHKDYGVFLTPTRMDSQGVSRDEAMSSGLVPVTTSVTAIPEFVDTTCGVLADGESSEDMALGIIALWEDPELFGKMSKAAAERVRRQSAFEQTIGVEVALISGGPISISGR